PRRGVRQRPAEQDSPPDGAAGEGEDQEVRPDPRRSSDAAGSRLPWSRASGTPDSYEISENRDGRRWAANVLSVARRPRSATTRPSAARPSISAASARRRPA